MAFKEEIASAPLSAAEKAEIAIEAIDLYKSFGENHVLKGFNMVVHQGENVVILGRSGSGKSVFIKCIAGLLKPDSGVLKVFGKEVTEMTRKEMEAMRKRVGFMFQGNALYDSMTVRENLEFPLRRHMGTTNFKREATERVEEVLEGVGLAHTKDKMPSELSGGMKKRIALARTLILRPDIILYDEPTSGLDPITSREISRLILEVQERFHAAALVITHDIECARLSGNRVSVLIDGLNYASGTFEEVKNNPDERVHAFFE